MRKRLVGALASAMFVFAACQGAATPAPSTAPAPSAAAPSTAGRRSAAPSASSAAAAPSTCSGRTTTDKPDGGTDGGKMIIGDWQEANRVQPVLPGPGRPRPTWRPRPGRPGRRHQRLQVRAGPRHGDPDARQRRRQGPRRQRRRDDGHVDPPRRPQVVRRPAAHLRRLQVRAGVGPGQGQRRPVVGRPATRTSRSSTAPSDTRWSWHFKKIYEGYITLMSAPLPRHYLSKIPIKDQVAGAGLPAGRHAEHAGQRRVQVRVA